MRKTANMLVLTLLCAFAAQAHALDLHNRSGDTLCVAETRDEPDPFDHDVGRITTGWKCVEDFGTLELEPSGNNLDIAVKRADGSDYVASRCLAFKASSCLPFEKTKTFVPKNDSTDEFGVYILKLSTGGVAYSWFVGAGAEWSSFQSSRNVDDLPARLDALGFKEFEAWRLDAQHSGLAYTLD